MHSSKVSNPVFRKLKSNVGLYINSFFLLVVILGGSTILSNAEVIKSTSSPDSSILFQQGTLNLSQHPDIPMEPYSLDGEWWFSWNEFLDPKSPNLENAVLIDSPNLWKKYQIDNEPLSLKGFASYYLKIELPENRQPLGIKLGQVWCAAKVWANGELVTQAGEPGRNYQEEKYQFAVKVAPLPSNVDTLDLIIHTSCFHHMNGGMARAHEIGHYEILQQEENSRRYRAISVISMALMLAFFLFIIYLGRPKEKANLYMTLALIFYAIRLLGTEKVLLFYFDGASSDWLLRAEYYGLFMAVPCFALFLNELFPEEFNRQLTLSYLGIGTLLSITTTFLPPEQFSYLHTPFEALILLILVNIFISMVLATKRKRAYARPIGISTITLVALVINDLMVYWQVYQGPLLVNIVYIVVSLGVVTLMALRLNKSFQLEVELTEQLQANNEELQKRVTARTQEIQQQNLRLEEQTKKLKQLDQQKSDFFANISHEFRTPLTLIHSPLQQLLNEYNEQLPAEVIEHLRIGSRNADRLTLLIEQLLTLSQLESDSIQLQAERNDIIGLLKRTASLFSHTADERHIEFTLEIPQAKSPIIFDQDKLETVVTNLLSNAFKYTHTGGRVKLAAYGPDTAEVERGADCFFTIAVIDNGQGIPPSDAPYIFDRFYRSPAANQNAIQGSGIGLALVKELIELHGGEIYMVPNTPSGSQFVVKLPLGEESLRPSVPSSRLELTQTSQNIPTSTNTLENASPNASTVQHDVLLVEDNYDMRQFLLNLLKANYSVITAKDGVEALNLLAQQPVKLIISDIMMPNMDGLTLLSRIRENIATKNLPVLLLTARAAEEDKILALKARADDYLAKPFDNEELLLRVRNILARIPNPISSEETTLSTEKIDTLDSADQQFLNSATTIVKENLNQTDFDVSALAQQLHMSKATLHRRMEKLSLSTPAAFIRRVRLEQAHEYIQAKHFKTRAEVAYAVGFNSPGYFSKLYKEFVKDLPETIEL